MILRSAVPKLSRRWVVAVLVVIVVGASTFAGLRAITGAEKIDPGACQAVVKEMNKRIYDARTHGLKTLSFRMRIDGGRPYPGLEKTVYAMVYWEAPDRINILPQDSAGHPVPLHPLLTWTVYKDYLRKSLPLGNARLSVFSEGELGR